MPAVCEPQIRQKHIRDGKTFSYVRNSNSEALLGEGKQYDFHIKNPATTTPKHARKRAAALAALVAGEEEEEDEEAEEEEDKEEEENARRRKGKAPATSARKGEALAQTLLLVAAEYADDAGFQGFGGEEEEEGEGGGDEDESELSLLDKEILTLGRS
ncbi:hypothetical protein AN8297.2 [Aspergillus nidulans FGSC A4]|uniref:Uncharacterized protein n=1 Tax=Emericella nidulans (strain FGSC A4 / ATCC 38163 / CBS 112.46 / NRRL 194 / M139) TaxID=227321 RepID=Q5ATT3_EMENI|nr:hypothetical protein [Aspergillus nidulans FGSC A4]EAA66862.1 hypothetical protein AN8297.2 [Aspergillus nidulans FGSC A4]CBF80255.1 TPA: hypothetical protein ANIA_08297 [Aspergillus nidulans FGSC A4]|eukprot:XP_681566.1 hypothetical protein AN8297.2 [Aspergillus nidulans FGSC A4]